MMKFEEILKGLESEGKEKHVPDIEIGKGRGEAGVDIVHVVVGREVPHPNTMEHHISWIEVYGVKKSGEVVCLGRSEFAPGFTNPNIRLQVPVPEFKAFCALSYCNVHGLWKNCLEV
ncbi:MAG: desulfoferrodoxin family protein [Methanosarcinales archaeon]